MHHHHHHRTHLACSLAACLAAGTASAQDGGTLDTRPPATELIARLDSPVFAARQRALADLLGRDELTLDAAEWMLTEPTLSPEQRLRLERLALEVFARGPRAAVGIRFPPETEGPVRIQEVLAGFPASVVLRAGDQILDADGMSMVRQATFRAAILSHAPGEVMPMTVLREGASFEVQVPLASFAALTGAAPPRPGDLLAAWTLRRARDAIEPLDAPVVPEPTTPEGAAGLPEPGSSAWASAFGTGDAPPGLRMGGQGRESIDRSLIQLAAADASRALTLEDLQDNGEADLAVQVASLRERRQRVLGDLERIGALIEGPNLDARGRAMMRFRLEEERQMLQVIEEQIRMLDEARHARP
jgi:hypothetical protein